MYGLWGKPSPLGAIPGVGPFACGIMPIPPGIGGLAAACIVSHDFQTVLI